MGGENIKVFISTIIGILCAYLFYIFGNIDTNLKYLIIVIIFDFVSGLGRAYIKKEVNSSVGLKGVFKKTCYFIIVSISVIVGNILEMGLLLRNIVIYSLIFNEIISIIENCGEIGVKIPNILLKSLRTFNLKNKKLDDEIVKKTKD